MKIEDIDIKEVIAIIKGAIEIMNDRELASNVKQKGIADYVTKVDVSVQKYLKDTFGEKYPEVDFVGEEEYEEKERKGFYWVVDPIDGTTNLIHDYHASAISVALIEDNHTVIGVIYQPYTDEVFYAQEGKGAFVNGHPIHVSDRVTIDKSLVAIGTSPYFKSLAEENFVKFKNIFLDCEDIRRSGSAAIDLAYVAAGRVEAYFERKLKIWDYAAGMLLVKEAGGKVLDFKGETISLTYEQDIVAGNGSIETVLVKNYL